jgi:hypothetical protein
MSNLNLLAFNEFETSVLHRDASARFALFRIGPNISSGNTKESNVGDYGSVSGAVISVVQICESSFPESPRTTEIRFPKDSKIHSAKCRHKVKHLANPGFRLTGQSHIRCPQVANPRSTHFT